MSTDFDRRCMVRALQLARRALYTTHPNPRVGCVISKARTVIAEGWHQRAGQPHAERHALAAAGDRARGATAYVTLEPCSHTGRTGPCADALVQAGIVRVVAAMQDPNPRIAGRGFRTLRDAGVTVEVGLQQNEAETLNAGFVRRMRGGHPWLRIKVAASLDGRTAMASGESKWITGPAAREDVQRLRARSSAIITGVGTVLADQPGYTVRPHQWQQAAYGNDWVRQPLRVILDRQLRTPPAAPVITNAGPCLIVCHEPDPARQRALEIAGAEVVSLPATDSGIDLTELLDELARRQCNEILVECGATLAGSFIRQGLFDELITYVAPSLLGSDARGLFNLPFTRMAEKVALQWRDVRRIGDDLRIIATPAATPR